MGTTQAQISLLPERLQAVRKQSGMSQAEFASRLGISPRGYKNYELGLRETPLAVIAAIHVEFGVDLTWLIFGKGAPSAQDAEINIGKIIAGIRSFEDSRNQRFSAEKTTIVVNYLFSQMARGRDFSEPEIHAYLETTL